MRKSRSRPQRFVPAGAIWVELARYEVKSHFRDFLRQKEKPMSFPPLPCPLCTDARDLCFRLGPNKGLYIHTLRLLNLSGILRMKHQFPRVLWRVSAEYRRWERSADSTGERTQSPSLARSGAGFRVNHLSPWASVSSSAEPAVWTAWLLAAVRF